LTGELLKKFKASSNKIKIMTKLMVYRKLEVFEDKKSNFRYASFVLKPKVVEFDLSDVYEFPPKQKEQSSSSSYSISSSASKSTPSQHETKKDKTPIKEKDKSDTHTKSSDKSKNPYYKDNIIVKEINKKSKNTKANYSIFSLLDELLFKIILVSALVLLLILLLFIAYKKRKLERDGYHGSLSGDFEIEGVKMMNETARSIEITDFERNSRNFDANKEFARKEKEIEIEMNSYKSN
jgi:hypothetical protein